MNFVLYRTHKHIHIHIQYARGGNNKMLFHHGYRTRVMMTILADGQEQARRMDGYVWKVGIE